MGYLGDFFSFLITPIAYGSFWVRERIQAAASLPELWQCLIFNSLCQAGDRTHTTAEIMLNRRYFLMAVFPPWFLFLFLLENMAYNIFVTIARSEEEKYIIIFSFFFSQLHLWHMEVSGPGTESELQLRPMPQPRHHQIWGTFATQTVAYHNTRSLTHWVDLNPLSGTSNPNPQRDNVGSLTCWGTMGTLKVYS